MLTRGPEPGRHQQSSEFIAVQADRMRLIVQPGPAHVSRG